MHPTSPPAATVFAVALALTVGFGASPARAAGEALLLIEADTGKVMTGGERERAPKRKTSAAPGER